MAKSAHFSRRRRLTVYVVCFAALSGVSFLVQSGSLKSPDVEAGLMNELKQLYQTDDSQEVIDRLVAESEASRLAAIARDQLGDSYAGSWFDADHLELVVGSTTLANNELLNRLGVRTVLMEHSLVVLRTMRDRLGTDFKIADLWGEVVTSLHIDYPTNQVVISAEAGSESIVEGFLDLDRYPGVFRIEKSLGRSVPVSWSVRGADEYTNDYFDSQLPQDFNCSIGFSVIGGYLTAGHCGDLGNPVTGFNGISQGHFTESDIGGGHDRAHVSTNENWIPAPWINGYGDGLMSVPAKWGALKEYPLYSTVCRYGQASNSHNCGIITETGVQETLNHQLTGDPYVVSDLKRTSACVKGGDSGGPFISPSDTQAQGITISAINSPCPDDVNLLRDATFDPIAGPLTAFNDIMLTAHGANQLNLENYQCPDFGRSGDGSYVCQIDHYNAQGQTTMQWSSSTGHLSQSALLSGTCLANEWVTVDLHLTNVYGNVQQNAGFWCPTGPIQ